MSKLNRILWTGLVLVGAACGDDVTVTPPPEPPPPGVRSVSVGPDGASVPVTGTLQMTAAVTTDPGAGAATITWSSSDNAKATVNATGLVTGVAVGSVAIRATATIGTSSAQGVATVNVVPLPSCVVSSVTITPSVNVTIQQGQTLQATAVVNGTAQCAQTVTWNSLTPGVASVSATGLITGVAGGTAVITATSTADPTKTAAVSVTVLVPEPATISIQSVTQGGLGAPVNLANVAGQIEVSLNIDRGDKTLSHVDVLIGGQVVATQAFPVQPVAGASAPETSAPVVVVLSINTRQLTQVGSLFIPVVFNGQTGITANLSVVGQPTPIGSNLVPVLMNNPDAATVPAALSDVSTAAPEPVNVAGTLWYKGSMQTSFNYIAFTNRAPASALTLLNAGCGTQTSTVTGTPTTGLSVNNVWTCAGVEGARNVTGPGATAWAAGTLGPDGSALVGPETAAPPVVTPGYSTVGAQFCVSTTVPCPAASRRWNLITPAPAGIPGPSFNVDNVAPVPTVGNVAFNDLFDQPWVNASYLFAQDVSAVDGGVGLNFVQARDYNDGVFVPASSGCTATQVTSGANYNETLASDGTPDGERICAYAEDLLGNAASSGPSNYFGVDKVAPVARLAGAAEGSGVTPALAPNTIASVSATPNTTIYGDGAGPLSGTFPVMPASDVWGLEALDTRSGFNQNAVAGFPAVQTLGRLAPTGATSCGLFTNPLSTVLSDTYVRTAVLVALDCGLGIGYYNYSGHVVDRAGNQSTAIVRNFAQDHLAAPALASIGPSTPLYTAGQPANFFLFGSDDLEIIEGDLAISYPNLGLITGTLEGITYPLANIAGAARWDALLNNIVTAGTIGVSNLLGRVDFTCTGAGAPYASCAGADAVATVAAEFNTVAGTNDAQNPDSVRAVAYDVANNASNAVAAGLLTAQTTDVAQQWVGADLITWRVLTPTGATVQAVHMASTSITAPYFDSVLLARIDAGGTELRVCGTFPAPALTDNGVNRFWTYTITKPTGSQQCAAGGNWYAIGLKNAAALVTQGQP